jgi:two-component system, NarL family, sensor histidine kinase DesK
VAAARAYAVGGMPSSMTWLAIAIRISIAPVLLGALAVVLHSQRAAGDLAAAMGLLLLAAIHIAYWWDPWQRSQARALAAAGSMVVLNFLLLNLLGLAEPLLWLYPALVAGAGLRTLVAIAAIGLTALAAAAPLALDGRLVHPVDPLHPAEALGPSHSVLLSIVLAGLGMHAVRQLIRLNLDLHATRAELADLAVAADRERLAREVHDLLARTLSLIAVKAELASRLSAKGDSAAAELSDVQRLARQAVRDVREAVTGSHAPSLEAEFAAAEVALRTAGIGLSLERNDAQIDPAHERTLAWAVREAVTNVVKHSGARTCRIALRTCDGVTSLEVADDGRGPANGHTGAGLDGLADRVRAVGGTLEVGRAAGRGFRLQVRLGVPAPAGGGGAEAGG